MVLILQLQFETPLELQSEQKADHCIQGLENEKVICTVFYDVAKILWDDLKKSPTFLSEYLLGQRIKLIQVASNSE